MSLITKNVYVVGSTGAGKSTFLRKLFRLDENSTLFKVNHGFTSGPTKIESCATIIEGTTFSIKVFDTPGLLLDTENQTSINVDEIVEKMRLETCHVLIFMVAYGKWEPALNNVIKSLCLCFDGLARSSCMLIINKVPRIINSEANRKRNQEITMNLNELTKIFCDVMKIKEMETMFFTNEDDIERQMPYNHIEEIQKWICHAKVQQINTNDFRTIEEVEKEKTDAVKQLENRVKENETLLEKKQNETIKAVEAENLSEWYLKIANWTFDKWQFLEYTGTTIISSIAASACCGAVGGVGGMAPGIAASVAVGFGPVMVVASPPMIHFAYATAYPIAGKLYKYKCDLKNQVASC